MRMLLAWTINRRASAMFLALLMGCTNSSASLGSDDSAAQASAMRSPSHIRELRDTTVSSPENALSSADLGLAPSFPPLQFALRVLAATSTCFTAHGEEPISADAFFAMAERGWAYVIRALRNAQLIDSKDGISNENVMLREQTIRLWPEIEALYQINFAGREFTPTKIASAVASQSTQSLTYLDVSQIADPRSEAYLKALLQVLNEAALQGLSDEAKFAPQVLYHKSRHGTSETMFAPLCLNMRGSLADQVGNASFFKNNHELNNVIFSEYAVEADAAYVVDLISRNIDETFDSISATCRTKSNKIHRVDRVTRTFAEQRWIQDYVLRVHRRFGDSRHHGAFTLGHLFISNQNGSHTSIRIQPQISNIFKLQTALWNLRAMKTLVQSRISYKLFALEMGYRDFVKILRGTPIADPDFKVLTQPLNDAERRRLDAMSVSAEKNLALFSLLPFETTDAFVLHLSRSYYALADRPYDHAEDCGAAAITPQDNEVYTRMFAQRDQALCNPESISAQKHSLNQHIKSQVETMFSQRTQQNSERTVKVISNGKDATVQLSAF